MLRDGYGRAITNMRISVTDRCNLRCVYCMPAEPVWMPQPEILSFEEIGRIVRVAVSLGITDFRITGGEPTARRNLPDLIRLVSTTPGVKDLAMTTNGILLSKLARPLREAG
jgi:cyclic pyranopterin phosphate synthase